MINRRMTLINSKNTLLVYELLPLILITLDMPFRIVVQNKYTTPTAPESFNSLRASSILIQLYLRSNTRFAARHVKTLAMNHRWTFNQVGRVPNNWATRLATKTIMRLTIKLTVICVRPNIPP